MNYSTPNTNRGGTSIYVKSINNIVERSDLNILYNDFESIWVEIKNKTSKNIVCGCIIYRHPLSNMDEF